MEHQIELIFQDSFAQKPNNQFCSKIIFYDSSLWHGKQIVFLWLSARADEKILTAVFEKNGYLRSISKERLIE